MTIQSLKQEGFEQRGDSPKRSRAGLKFQTKNIQESYSLKRQDLSETMQSFKQDTEVAPGGTNPGHGSQILDSDRPRVPTQGPDPVDKVKRLKAESSR